MHAGEGKHHHHKKDTDDTYGGGGGADQSGGYGGNTTDQVLPPSPCQCVMRQTGCLAPLKAPACAQGYGGGSAVGGGQTGGDQFTSDEPSRKRQGQDAAYGGDQTDLDAGADTNFGVSAFQCRF